MTRKALPTLLFVLVAALALPLLAQNNPDTAVWTDKGNYLPGEVATVTGVGFQPGEVVNLVFHVDGREDRTSTANADENGGFTNNAFSPDSLDAEATIKLIATGTTSGFEAVNYFLDGDNPLVCDATHSYTVDKNTGTASGPVFDTIQHAIDAIPKPATAPCTVNVKAGTYNELVTISGRTDAAINLVRDSTAGLGQVVIDPSSLKNDKLAISIQSSRFITIQGLKITRASQTAVSVGASSSDVNIVANDISANADGVLITKNQPRIWVYNNLICNNTGNGLQIDNPNGTASYIVNNTMYSNGGRGIFVAGGISAVLINNLIVGNSGFGIQQNGSGSGVPTVLKNNMLYKNTAGDITAALLDPGDSGNYTTAGTGTGIAGCTFADCGASHANSEILNTTNSHLASGSPAADKGLNSFIDGVQRVPNIDIDGDGRPVNTTVDIGADERALTSPPPAPVITGKPDNPTGQKDATFIFTESDTNATLECDIDNLGFAGCTSPKTYSGLGDGSHTFTVKATNTAGSSTAQHTWVIDTALPSSSASVTAGTAGSNGWYKSNVTVTITATKTGGSIKQIIYAVNGGATQAVNADTAPVNVSAEGTTTITYHAVDTLGNVETPENTFTVKIDKTAPTATLAVTGGTPGNNGWYTTAVTLHASGTDANAVTCDDDVVVSTNTAGHDYTLTCTDEAGWSRQTNTINIKLDTTDPTANLEVTAGTAGANGWYTSNVTVTASGTDDISEPVTCTPATQSVTNETAGQELSAICENAAGRKKTATLTVKVDKTAPTDVALSITAGTTGANGWYTSDVTIHTSGKDDISGVTCTTDQQQTAETTGAQVNGSCTNGAGLKTDAAPITIKLDKTAPPAKLEVTTGTAGLNGWYTSDVTATASGTDDISGPVTCTPETQSVLTETTGEVLNASCKNQAGLTANAAPLTVKIDKTAPTGVALAVTSGTLGNNGWYISSVTIHTSGTDSISGVDCTVDQYQTTDTSSAVFSGSCTNGAGLTAAAAPLTIKRDATPPSLTPSVSPNPVVLNGTATASAGALDATSGVASSSCGALVLTSVGSKTVSCTATDNAGNSNTGSTAYSVTYAPLGTACMGDLGHAILQPIDADNSSVFKWKSTVPAKFRVCDANGMSIGTAGVVSSFRLIQTVAGTVSQSVDEQVISTTPDAAFRWDPTSAQWIFNMNTKNLNAGVTYFYRITLNDGSVIDFRFGLR